jgi:hypothetical protein
LILTGKYSHKNGVLTLNEQLKHNRIADPRYADTIKQLKKELTRLPHKYNDEPAHFLEPVEVAPTGVLADRSSSLQRMGMRR